MRFKNLNPVQRQAIIDTYATEPSRDKAQEVLAKKYRVDKRTIRNWAKKLGLNTPGEVVVKAEVVNPSPAKILLLDIETAPLRGFIWSIWNVNLGHNLKMLKADWFILTWAAKWLFEPGIMSDRLTPDEVFKEDDSRITKSIWDLVDEADVIIAHNGFKFDMKRLNTRFMKWKLNLPMPYQLIDTLVHARKQLALTSNKLDYIGDFFGIGRKIDTGGFELWDRCMQGEEQALIEMEEYNKGDVILLEDVYLELRPMIKPHPNMGLFISEDVDCCPTCASRSLDWIGTYRTYANAYDAFRCNDCGAVGRSRTSLTPKRSKKNLTISTP